LNVTTAPLPEGCVCVLIHVAANVQHVYDDADSSLWRSLVFPC
jgi:hypothetical protein